MIKEKIIKIEGKDYQVKFPNVGQFIAIESMKLSFTKGKYVQMSLGDFNNNVFTLDMADAVSYLSILIPDLKKEFAPEGWWEMDLHSAHMLVSVYKKQFVPWFLPLMKDLYKYDEDDEVEDDAEPKE